MGSIVHLSGFTSFLTILALAFGLFSAPVVLAQSNSNAANSVAPTIEVKDYKQEVVSLVDRAQACINENGKEKAPAAFNDPDGPFVKPPRRTSTPTGWRRPIRPGPPAAR